MGTTSSFYKQGGLECVNCSGLGATSGQAVLVLVHTVTVPRLVVSQVVTVIYFVTHSLLVGKLHVQDHAFVGHLAVLPCSVLLSKQAGINLLTSA